MDQGQLENAPVEHPSNIAGHANETNWLDIGVVLLMLISGLFAMMRGLVREAFILIGWIGAFYAAVHFMPVIQPWMRTQFKNPLTADAVAGLSIFCATLIVLIPINTFIMGKIQGTALTAIDRSLGFVFGILRGALIVCLLFLLAQHFWAKPEDAPKFVQKAKTLPLLEAGADVIDSMIPESKRKALLDRARHTTDREERARLLRELGSPQPEPELNKNQPAYDNTSRQELDQLIERKSQ